MPLLSDVEMERVLTRLAEMASLGEGLSEALTTLADFCQERKLYETACHLRTMASDFNNYIE